MSVEEIKRRQHELQKKKYFKVITKRRKIKRKRAEIHCRNMYARGWSLYKCVDCGEVTWVTVRQQQSRHGNYCSSCGGHFLEAVPDPINVLIKNAIQELRPEAKARKIKGLIYSNTATRPGRPGGPGCEHRR